MISIKNLNVAYGQSEIIHDVSLQVDQGEVIAVMGKNGMGKTTLMKSVIGLLKPTSGSIELDGVDVTSWDSYRRVAQGIAYVPQGRQIFSQLTVEENILTGLNPHSPNKKQLFKEIYSMFPVLYEMSKRKGGNLSGGQQQQLAIARALVSEPNVLLLDEPTEGIQPSIIKDIAKLLNEIKKTKNLAILVSEQALSFTVDIADRIFIIESGRFIYENVCGSINEEKIKTFLSV
ncbi:MAG TPA: urea ABC transporter ATP-binding subunit UrtE [Syntrophales bacterium]|nr:urea ABC transporter ATP-binding subunit UrtE [Syntrophales bacterium]